MPSSAGSQISGFTAQLSGILLTSNPIGTSVAATIGSFFVPGIPAASKAAIAGAVFTGSWLFAGFAIPIVGGLLGLSFMVPSPEAALKYRLLALVVGFANVILCAGIAASALSATGLPVSFGTTAVCLLAGTGVIMLATAVITGALATCFFSAIGDVFHNGQGSDFASGLWS